MPLLNGNPIDSNASFDLLVLTFDPDYDDFFRNAYLYTVDAVTGAETSVGYVYNDKGLYEGTEIDEIVKRIDDGRCRREYQWEGSVGERFNDDSMVHHLWWLTTTHPFHPYDKDPHKFFEQLTKGANWEAATALMPTRFNFPGIVDGASRRYYKRQDNAAAPDVNNLSGLAPAGWSDEIPYGSHRVYAVDVLDTPKGVDVSHPQAIYHRRKDVDGDLRAIARKWHSYWTGLTSSEQGINVRMTLRKHVEHAIGRAWAEKPFGGDIRVFYEGNSGASDRDARYAEDWMLGNLEQWAHDWGFAAFALALSNSGNRVALESQLGDYTFCLVKQDGSVGDRLANPNEGILEATWDAWGSTDYNAALGTIISVATGVDKTVDSGSNQVLVSTASVVNPVGATTYQWEQESGPEQTLSDATSAHATFQAPTLEAGDDAIVLVFKVTATNNGESASDTITVTVNPPASE